MDKASGETLNHALFANFTSDRKILERILQELTQDQFCCEEPSYSWSVSNKYYSATVHLHWIDMAFKTATLSGHNYDAVVLVLDKMLMLTEVKESWSRICEQLDEVPEVCVCVVVGGGESEELLHWTVREHLELIRWDQNQDQDLEGEESSEVKRLSDVLQAHSWPQLTLVSPPKVSVKDTATGPAATAPASDKSKLEDRESDYKSMEEQLLAEGLDQDPGGESFENLFSRFAAMKERAQGLPDEERKLYAEKVVMAFWEGIGGDEDEIRDLPSK